jgi:hypothetical protein
MVVHGYNTNTMEAEAGWLWDSASKNKQKFIISNNANCFLAELEFIIISMVLLKFSNILCPLNYCHESK